MYTSKTMEVLESINKSTNKNFRIYEEEITSCGYKGLCIVSKEPIIENAYQISADLILNEIVYEVAVLDFIRCRVYTHYRDYGYGLGKQIMLEKEDFDRYARKDLSAIGKGVHIRITTLAIKEEDLIKISDMTEIKEVINFIQGLYPITKPKPIISGDIKEYELIELINYEDRNFKVEEYFNLDDFREGYLLEGKLTGDVPSRLEDLIYESKRIIDAVMFVETNENKGFIKYKNNKIVEDFDLPGYIIQPKLRVDNSYVVIKVFLDLKDLQSIHTKKSFEEVFQYLQTESIKEFETPVFMNDLIDLPF